MDLSAHSVNLFQSHPAVHLSNLPTTPPCILPSSWALCMPLWLRPPWCLSCIGRECSGNSLPFLTKMSNPMAGPGCREEQLRWSSWWPCSTGLARKMWVTMGRNTLVIWHLKFHWYQVPAAVWDLLQDPLFFFHRGIQGIRQITATNFQPLALKQGGPPFWPACHSNPFPDPVCCLCFCSLPVLLPYYLLFALLLLCYLPLPQSAVCPTQAVHATGGMCAIGCPILF